MPRRSKRTSKRSKREQMRIANPRQQLSNNPDQVLVTMRLGIYTFLQVTTPSAIQAFRIDDPIGLINDWPVRSQDFLMYRIKHIRFTVMPTTNSPAAATTITQGYVSAIVTSALNPPVNPLTAQALLEIPSSQIRPLNPANPRNARVFNWRPSDINNMAYNNVTVRPELTTVTLYLCALTALASPSTLSVVGHMDVEFKGIAVV